jgi:hypothetical protein
MKKNGTAVPNMKFRKRGCSISKIAPTCIPITRNAIKSFSILIALYCD